MGEVDVDVGRFLPFGAQEALEEQPELDRIDGSDAETEADGRVGRRAASLAEHALAPREAHDVPHDEEVAGQPELSDELQLVRDLPRRARRCACAPQRSHAPCSTSRARYSSAETPGGSGKAGSVGWSSPSRKAHRSATATVARTPDDRAASAGASAPAT